MKLNRQKLIIKYCGIFVEINLQSLHKLLFSMRLNHGQLVQTTSYLDIK